MTFFFRHFDIIFSKANILIERTPWNVSPNTTISTVALRSGVYLRKSTTSTSRQNMGTVSNQLKVTGIDLGPAMLVNNFLQTLMVNVVLL